MLEGVRGRRIGTAIFIAIIFAIVITVTNRWAEEQRREAEASGFSLVALSVDSLSVAD